MDRNLFNQGPLYLGNLLPLVITNSAAVSLPFCVYVCAQVIVCIG